jgi:hypothetical protein
MKNIEQLVLFSFVINFDLFIQPQDVRENGAWGYLYLECLHFSF